MRPPEKGKPDRSVGPATRTRWKTIASRRQWGRTNSARIRQLEAMVAERDHVIEWLTADRRWYVALLADFIIPDREDAA